MKQYYTRQQLLENILNPSKPRVIDDVEVVLTTIDLQAHNKRMIADAEWKEKFSVEDFRKNCNHSWINSGLKKQGIRQKVCLNCGLTENFI